MSNEPSFDPDDPVFAFVNGLATLMSKQDQIEPDQLRASVETLVAAFPAPPPLPGASPSEHAAALIASLDSIAGGGDEDPAVTALQALRLWPQYSDGYVILGYELADEPALALPIFSVGMMVAEESLEPGALERDDGMLAEVAGGPEFLRALDGMARMSLASGDMETAAGLFAEMMRLDADDSQDARYPLLSIALTLGLADIAGQILSAFAGDTAPEFLYGRALLAFQQDGESTEANARLAEAKTRNAHVPAFLLATSEIGEVAEEPAPGSVDEGALCALALADAWAATPGAADWLRAQAAPSRPAATPSKERRSGPRSID